MSKPKSYKSLKKCLYECITSAGNALDKIKHGENDYYIAVDVQESFLHIQKAVEIQHKRLHSGK